MVCYRENLYYHIYTKKSINPKFIHFHLHSAKILTSFIIKVTLYVAIEQSPFYLLLGIKHIPRDKVQSTYSAY